MGLPGTFLRVGVDVLRSTISAKTKSILLQIGDVLTGVAETDNVELWQTFGLVSRPPKAEAGKAAAQAVVASAGDKDIAIAGRDIRGQELVGSLEEGETCLYAAGPEGTSQGRVLLKGNGNLAMYTAEGNEAGGSSVTVQCNADGSIVAASQYAALYIGPDGFKLAHKDGGGIQLKDGKWAIIGDEVALNAGAVSLGANAIMPAIYGPAGIAGVASTSVKIAM